MKTIFKIIVILTASVGYAQDNIVPIEETYLHNPFEQPKVYYKDINGVFNKFIGTWKWQDLPNNPTKVFQITFYKNEMRDEGSISFTDELVSKFQYISNGTVIYNTYLGDYKGHISGSWLPPNSSYTLSNGLTIENTKMELHYSEPIIDNRPLRKNPNGKLYLEYQNLNSVEKLIWNVECFLDQNGNIPFRIPITMTLIKQ